MSSLEELRSDKNIIIYKPDKGTGTVILHKSDYITEMELILDDKINFNKSTDDLYKTIMKFEDKNNRLIEQLFKSGAIGDVDRKKLKSSGSRSGEMFGIPQWYTKSSLERYIFQIYFIYKLLAQL